MQNGITVATYQLLMNPLRSVTTYLYHLFYADTVFKDNFLYVLVTFLIKDNFLYVLVTSLNQWLSSQMAKFCGYISVVNELIMWCKCNVSHFNLSSETKLTRPLMLLSSPWDIV
jgi:hypothetical protein